MKRLALLLVLFLLAGVASNSFSQDDKQILTTVSNYSEGAYSGIGSRMAIALGDDVQKVAVQRLQNGMEGITYSTRSLLIAGADAGLVKTPEEQRNMVVSIVDKTDRLACVRLDSVKFIDLLCLAKINGEWKIIHDVWGSPAIAELPVGDSDVKAVEEAVNNYIDGLYSSNAERIASSVHPELHHAMLSKIRGTDLEYIYRTGRSFLELDAKSKMTAVPEEARSIKINILEIIGNMATVRLNSRLINGYVQLLKLNGSWQVINVLWTLPS